MITIPESMILLRGQAAYMRDHGFEVHVVSSPGEALHSLGLQEGIVVHAISMSRRITPVEDLRALVQLTRLIRNLRPAIVHAHTPKGGLLGMLAALAAGVPRRIYHMRGLPFETATGSRRALLRGTEWVTSAIANRVLCVSHSLRRVAIREGLARPSKFRVLASGSGNGVDAIIRFVPELYRQQRAAVRREFGIPADAVVTLFVGRLAYDKGIADLVEAWASLREKDKRAFLLVAGPHDDRDGLSSEVIAALQNDPRVRLIYGWVDTPPLYGAADVVVLPSYREGFPNVPLEAAAMGLPVVVSDVTGCIDAVVPDITGLVVPVRDANALADALARYIADDALRTRHGHAGRERVLRDFQQQAIWDEINVLYRALLRWRPSPAHPCAASRQPVTSSPLVAYKAVEFARSEPPDNNLS